MAAEQKSEDKTDQVVLEEEYGERFPDAQQQTEKDPGPDDGDTLG